MASTRQLGSDTLLNAAMLSLGFALGQLLSADKQISDETRAEWVEKGDWLSLAKFVGAEKLFFVEQNPVIVFARTDTNDRLLLRELYNRIWCMARPQLLFLACPGEVSVYDLSKPPVAVDESIDAQERLISETVRTVADVQSQLSAFRREEIETGRFFETTTFKGGTDRADKALIPKIVKYLSVHLLTDHFFWHKCNPLVSLTAMYEPLSLVFDQGNPSGNRPGTRRHQISFI